MGESATVVSSHTLIKSLGTAGFPTVIDVRRADAFAKSEWVIPTARWRDHRQAATWASDLAGADDIVVYCVHGHQVSEAAATLLRARGIRVRVLDGGIEAYRAAGGPVIRKAALPAQLGGQASHWVTRARPKVDRIACPWFIRRFVDRHAVFHFVASDWVRHVGDEIGAIPFDIPDTEFSHVGELCSFDAFLGRFAIDDPALARLARIVRGADTARLDLAPQAAGLLAMSLGLSAIIDDDMAMLAQGMTLYDALYGWCRFAAGESHDWRPDKISSPAPAMSA